MNQAFVMTMKRPHEVLGLRAPVGRKIGDMGKKVGKNAWLALVMCLTVAGAGLYIYQVNASASKGFTVRKLETQRQHLQDEVASLEDQSVKQQAMSTLQEKVKHMGYVPVDWMDFVDIASGYALAK